MFTVQKSRNYCWQEALLAVLLFPALAEASSAAPAYDVVWNSPSTNHHGSMPLGNGDITLNTWMTPTGDIHLYIGKTDAWDDNARLLKVGKVVLHLEPNPISAGQPFQQKLNPKEGTVDIDIGEQHDTQIRIWVDANEPVANVTTRSRNPLEITATSYIWRTNREEIAELQISDVLFNRKTSDKRQEPMFTEPDSIVTALKDRIGWYHHNTRSLGPQLLSELQGLTGFKQADPIVNRVFGAVITADHAERLNDRQLLSRKAQAHQVSIFVLTKHPSSPGEWLSSMNETINRVESRSFSSRFKAHLKWWREFNERSWIRASANSTVAEPTQGVVPSNQHPIVLGMDQTGGNRFVGELGRVTISGRPLTEDEIGLLARSDPAGAARPDALVSSTTIGKVPDSSELDLKKGITIEAWLKPAELPGSGARIVDKITPGGSDGFLLDTFPGNGLRFICGEKLIQQKDGVPAGQWTHVAAVADSATGVCRLYVNGKQVGGDTAPSIQDPAKLVSQKYALQRFITACSGRGAYPIKFNGSLFTVPPGPTERDPDYRRWGPGYWWQNTRLPYISLCTSGDFDLQQPLFRMYADQLLPLSKYRTSHYFAHNGAYYPECIMFWGAVFGETYGWTPFAERTDKLQESGWHKWEWVGGLELCWMMLDYYDHTQDKAFLTRTALPFCNEILTYFDEHYSTDAGGKLVMYPSQALETWWNCTNATPELAGCIAVTSRLLGLSHQLTAPSERSFWKKFESKLPPIPVRDVEGAKALAPATFFEKKSNIENAELYPVFPFRLFAFNRPNADWATTALKHRWDRGHAGWRQDDIFMAYLGLQEEARKAVVSRAGAYDPQERFPAFWGPNYDWTPDQDHGGVLMKAFQSMLLQTDGAKVFLFPAWPKNWDVDFKLHAPLKTTVEGVYKGGKLVSLKVTPLSRRPDVIVCWPSEP